MVYNQNLAPICLFVYNRLDNVRKTILALQNNNLALKSELFVFSDGAKSEEDYLKVKEVRGFLDSVNGFKRIQIFKNEINKGLASSVISGVTKIINNYGKIIVVEDP